MRHTTRIARLLICLAFAFLAVPLGAAAQPAFDKAFAPASIGPGGVSKLTFTIDNSGGGTTTDLAFTDNMPAGMTVAAGTTTDSCLDGTLTAVPGSGTISYSGGKIGAAQSCTITVPVTSSTVGVGMNVSGDLTSSAGNSGTATADLTVSTGLPGFSKSLSPSTVFLGGQSTLTYLIDNTANGSTVDSLDFTESLPVGITIASPSNASTTCGTTTIPPTLTAPAGGSTITLDANGISSFPAVAAGASCTVTVDIVAGAAGVFNLVSGQLLANFVDAGFSSAALTVNATEINLSKTFTDDPIGAPGGTVTLEFTVRNRNRTLSATNIAFSDDLSAMVAGAATTGALPSDPCGAGSSLTGGATLSLSGGNLPPEGSCTFSVSVAVPATTAGQKTNTTSAITADVGAAPVVGNVATAPLTVVSGTPLTFSKSFTDDPVAPGTNVTLEFTIQNPNATEAASDIAFIDELTTFLPFPVSVSSIPATPCGAGSDLSLVSLGTDRQGLSLTGGNLASAPASCTFSVSVLVPIGQPGGTYVNTTETLTATIGGATVMTAGASDTLTVGGGTDVSFTKAFEDTQDGADDGIVLTGNQVDVLFTLTNSSESANPAAAIAFTDDLAAFAAGSTFDTLQFNDCGGTASGAGTTTFTYSGGTLAVGASCSIRIRVTINGGSGSQTNTTSDLSFTAGGAAGAAPAASASLVVGSGVPVTLSKEFIDDPVVPGGSATARFTLTNPNVATDATGIFFTDPFDAMVSGTTITNPAAATAACGGTLTPLAGGFLFLSGASLSAGTSCVFDVTVSIPAGTTSGNYTNVTSNVTSSLGTGSAASAVLVVDSTGFSFAKSFTDDPVTPGADATLEFTVQNLSSTEAASAVAFSDDLNAMLAGTLVGSVLLDTCGGTPGGTGTGTFTYSGGSIAAGATCTIRIAATVAGGASAGSFSNVTSSLTGTVGGLTLTADPAIDTLTVNAVSAPTLSKSFSPSDLAAGGSTTLSFTITNTSATAGVSDMRFTDNLAAALAGLASTSGTQTDVCGAGSQISGTSLLTFTGGSLPAGGSCTFNVAVQVPAGAAPGDYTNTTSGLSFASGSVAAGASAMFSVEPPSGFSKTFASDPISEGGVSTLVFTIDNSASALPATALAFTDNLPAGLEVAPTPAASTTCSGGTLTAAAGSGSITYGGGSVAAGASCTISVDVRGVTPGAASNTSGALTSSLGDSGTASDTLTVTAAPAPGFSKAFAPGSVVEGATSTLTFTIDNSAALVQATGLDFTDALPALLQVASTPNASTTCSGGTITAVAGGGTVSYTGGAIAAGASCTVSVDVVTLGDGSAVNTSGDLTSSLGNSGTAGATLTITPAPVPAFSKAFVPGSVIQGQTSTLTFTVNNTALVDATGVAFDDLFPAGLEVAAVPNVSNGCAGAFSAVAGATSVSLAGGSVAATASCTIDVDVLVTGSASLINTTTDLTSSLGVSAPASANLNVTPSGVPGFSKAFSPGSVVQGGFATLTFTIANSTSASAATGLAFVDNFPAGLVVADTPNVTNTCGGTFTAAARATGVDLTGGSVAAGATCTIEVDTRAIGAASQLNTSGDLTSSLGNSGPASATLVVTPAPVPGFSKAFAPGAIAIGGTATLTFTIDNSAALVDVTSLAFTDTFPAGLSVAGTPNVSSGCGGTFTATAGAASVSLSGGTVAARAICTVSVDTIATAAGTLSNTSGTLTSSLGVSAAATADLGVSTAPAPTLLTMLANTNLSRGEQTVLTVDIDNSGAMVSVTDIDVVVTFSGGLEIADSSAPPRVLLPISPANLSAGCTAGTLTATPGDTGLTFTDGSVAPGATCRITVGVVAVTEGSGFSVSGSLTSPAGGSIAPPVIVNVAAPPPPDLSKSFSPASIAQGDVATLSFVVDNTAAAVSATALAFDDTFPAGLTVAAVPNPSDGCGGVLTAAAGAASLDYSGGSVAAGVTCTITVDVTSAVPGTYVNTSSALSSDLGSGSTASATLVVTSAPPPGFAKSFAPDTILQDQTSTLTFTIDNGAALVSATNLAFTDTFPADVFVAPVPNVVNGCGGTFSAAAGASAVTLSGGSVGAASICTIAVEVTSAAVGTHLNTSGALTSSLGSSGTASASLTVNVQPNGTVTIVQETDTDGTFNFSSSEASLNFAIVTSGGTGQAGPISIAAGTYLVSQAAPSGIGNSAIVCDDGDSAGDAAAGELTIRLAAREAVTCTFRAIESRQKTVDTVNRFLTRRANFILSSEPGNSRRIDRLNRGFGNAQQLSFANGDLAAMNPVTFDLLSIGSGDYTVSTSMLQMRQAAASLALAHGDPGGTRYVENYRWDVWFEANYNEFDEGATSEGHFAIGYLGADYLLTPDVLVGALVQVDRMKDRSSANNSTVSGTGWLAGPYVTARLAPNLYFDGRVAAGRSDNEISPFNTYIDTFETSRWLAIASLTGQFERGPWTIRPTASLGYFQETQDSYVDSVGVTIPSQTVSLAQLQIGPTFTGRFEGANGMLYEPFFEIEALYNMGDTSGVTVSNASTVHNDGWRGRLKAGVTMTTEGGARLGFSGIYDGIGRDDFDSYGFAFDLEIPFYKAKSR